ncbi:hypothetical protein CH249_05965 [Rhodococcus sp. 05-2255-3B1]|uniref:hypothetical protein n=1 Tax=unclassified Rhodococcus (in: high G+C Gram-positive bacteria) TaxID=192944 RepID=UPI000B9AB03D|nr:MULTISPECIES: hypothetical protein [unclassified Rhodococcus (in: high G+C Gram-positive bacteria)]OZE12409.1 hypothetical protein CH250_09050 [Rhodococcus sp. 05-2255-3C]OZE14004.1 hypothetical protein CH249_05965 [Rhodococcus sp. 05-2255-3B1]OZE19750.1 hypothetical protein CH255_10855 [Rhodococcus sp. 05-2255-2A2]
MDSPSGKKLVAMLAAVGASTGAAAAVVWHVAVVDPQDLGVTYARPSWFPVSLYLVAAGLAAGLVVASFLVDAGLRIVQDRRRSRVHLFVVLIVVGVALGAGSALAWTHWPPQPTEVASNWWWEHPLSIEINSPPAADFGWTSIGSSVSDTYVAETYETDAVFVPYLGDEEVPSTFAPTIGNPWLVFPIGGVAIAALAAFTLSLRDFRLTVVSRSDPDAV